MGIAKLVLRYASFALIAMLLNLLAQFLLVISYKGSHAIPASIGLGTIVGLVAKYELDKRYIFSFLPRGSFDNGRTFLLYTLMGGLTTAIFWAVEYGFHFFFGDDLMRYVGGAMGLAVGYLIKYQLDKRYVFARSPN